MSLPRFALKYRVVTLSMVAVAMVFGAARFATMSRRADPAFTVRTCQVRTQWPGADVQRVEQLVTRPLEEAINKLDRVQDISSTSTPGLSVLTVDLDDNTPAGEVQGEWERVRAKVGDIRASLPEGVLDPVVIDDFADTAVMIVAVFARADQSPGVELADGDSAYSARQLEVIADRVRERIALTPGVAKAELHGVHREAIFLETAPGNWANLALTTGMLADLLQARNIRASGGSLETEAMRIGILPTGEFSAVSQIESLVVERDGTGSPVYLRDLGIQVRRGYEDPPGVLTRFGDAAGSAPCVVVAFTMKDGVKVTELGRRVQQLLVDLREKEKMIPPDIGLEVVFDESVFVEDKIRDFVNNVLQSILIVVAVALLMAGLRPSLVMAAAIPFVMIISIGASSLLGVELEQMSIASLIIALGMLVDNAVVVSDNVARLQRETDLPRQEAVAQGVEQIQYAILMGTLTTVFAFLPLAICLEGTKREYVFSIPAVVSITLLTSWVLALTLSTLLAHGIIRPTKGPASPLEWLGARLGFGTAGRFAAFSPDRLYGNLVSLCLRMKLPVLGVSLGLLAASLALPVGTQFFPQDQRDMFFIDVWLPEGTSWEATNRAVGEVEGLLRELAVDSEGNSRLARHYTAIGGSGPRFALGVAPQPPASNFSQIIVRTTNARATDGYLRDLQRAADQLTGARVVARKLELGPPIDAPLAIRVYGAGFNEPGFVDETPLREAAARVKEVFHGLDDVWDVHDKWDDHGYQLDVTIDPDRANLAGVSNAAVARSLSAYYSGHQLTVFRERDHRVPVYFRLPPEERTGFVDPRALFVEGGAGKLPLDAVADVRTRLETRKIERRELNRMIEVRARVRPGVLANDKLDEALPQLAEIERSLPPGMRLEIAGEREETEESAAQMSLSFAVAIVLMVLVLIVQYNSLIKPAIILATVPLGAIGALGGLWLTGNAMGFMPMLGFVSLAGIVVNSAILFIEFADSTIQQRLAEGRGIAKEGERSFNGLTREAFREALAEAGRVRLLPIFLTTSTTVCGLIPLALFGGPMWEGMAYLLIVGLVCATALTLLVLPVLYAACVEWFRFKLA